MFHVPNVGMTLPLNLLFGLAYGGAEAVVDLLVDAIARFVPDEIRDRIDGGVEELVGLPEVGLELSIGLPFLEMESEHPNVKSNFSYLNRALRAIIENASTFSPEGSTIVLRARELDSFNQGFGFYEISVSDKGIGIEENDLTRIFEPFVRVKDTRLDDDIPHMGLGLSTAKQLIQSLGGNILVTSELGAGSTFSIRVQLEIDEGEGETSVTDALKGKNVLVVEDNQINREILCEYLEMEGANVVPAKDGQVAYDEFLEREPGFFDIITMDIHMPNMDGYEATRCIRACKEKGGETVKIIAVTSDTHSEDVRRILSSGMDAHVAKPVDIKALKAAIHTLSAS